MSGMNQSGEEQVECPLCMEPLEVDDLHFYPCTCGYQICRFCWNRIREGENGLCPACRKAYPENPADFTPLSQEQVAAIKTEKKAREQKRRNKTLESRRALANVRVVQNNLVFVVGLPVRLADPEILKRQEYFGKYGKIHKVVINQSTTYAGSQGPSASAYVTYVSSADALRAIQGVNNVTLDGRVLKGSLGTTKYCANFMKNQPCPKPDCMYLHDLGDPDASFTKEEMHAGLHQVYERKLHNQLLQAQRDRPPADDRPHTSSGNSSTNAEKGSPKDGNQSNFIPTTVVTSSHINVVNSSKSKKESVNGSGGSVNGSNSSNGKEAWPSLGTSPPTDSPARKQSSPKPQHSTVKSQENGTSESSSPTQQTQPQAQTKTSKDNNHTENNKTNRSNRENTSTNGQISKKSKTEKSKQKNSNSINNDIDDTETAAVQSTATNDEVHSTQDTHSVFDSEMQQQNYLSNELDELESDRHSLLENHDLLDNSDHNLLDDDNTHNLLNDANSELMMMQRHRDMLAGLVDNNHLLTQIKSPLVNGYGLIDRDTMNYISNDKQLSQINQASLEQKELLLLREQQSRNEMIMRQNEMLVRQHNVMVEPKHYMPTSSIGLDSTSELLGANFHPNPSMLPPFGMRVDNSMAASSMSANTMSAGSMSGNPMGAAMGGFLPHHQQLLQQNHQQMQQSGLVNGFDTPQSVNEGRYLAENMDKFFTDFHKAQQMRLMARGAEQRRYPESHHYPTPQNMLSAERLEMEHKQRMNSIRASEQHQQQQQQQQQHQQQQQQHSIMSGSSGRASGDADDDLDFDPIKETQKALAEMMETEMMQNAVSSGDNLERVRRARLAPPGFSSAYGVSAPRPQIHHNHTHHQGVSGFSSNNAMYTDWTQMDPAIMSTSVKFGKPAPAQPLLTHQQQELFARFHQLGVNGVKQATPAGPPHWAWPAAPYANVPLPPGFAPAKPTQHPAECIDAK